MFETYPEAEVYFVVVNCDCKGVRLGTMSVISSDEIKQ